MVRVNVKFICLDLCRFINSFELHSMFYLTFHTTQEKDTKQRYLFYWLSRFVGNRYIITTKKQDNCLCFVHYLPDCAHLMQTATELNYLNNWRTPRARRVSW